MVMDLPEQERHVKVDNQSLPSAYYMCAHLEDGMHELTCLIQSCQAKVYAPAGTHSVCRAHFLSYLTWRRRKGPQMFLKYAGMTMEERDPLVAEWADTIRTEETPASAQKV